MWGRVTEYESPTGTPPHAHVFLESGAQRSARGLFGLCLISYCDCLTVEFLSEWTDPNVTLLRARSQSLAAEPEVAGAGGADGRRDPR